MIFDVVCFAKHPHHLISTWLKSLLKPSNHPCTCAVKASGGRSCAPHPPNKHWWKAKESNKWNWGVIRWEKPAPPTQPGRKHPTLSMTHSSGMTFHTCMEHQQHRIDFWVTCCSCMTVRSCMASHLCIYRCLFIYICYCIIATEKDHHSVVEMFGKKKKKFLGNFQPVSG